MPIETLVVLPLALCRGDDVFLKDVSSEQPLLQPPREESESVRHLHRDGFRQVAQERRREYRIGVAELIDGTDVPVKQAGTKLYEVSS
jgi:hypothetical protein